MTTRRIDRVPIAAVMPGLTGLRGIAALWVTAYHVGVISRASPSTSLDAMLPITASGWLGVDLFFLLSGFVLMHAHAGQFAGSFLSATPRFLTARCWRVYPLNAAVLALILVIVSCDRAFAAMVQSNGAADLSWPEFLRTLMLGTRWFSYTDKGWNEPVWSLSLEIVGYALFPILAYGANAIRSHRQALFAAAIALAVLLALEGRLGTLNVNIIGGRLAWWRMTCEFGAGVLLYRARVLAPRGAIADASAVALAACATIVLAVALDMAGIACLGFAGLVWALSFAPAGGVARFFASRAALLLGRISFPLYLLHGMALRWTMSLIRRSGIDQRAAAELMLAAGIVAIVTVAWLLHRWVERPCARRSSRIARQTTKGGNLVEAPPLPSVGSVA